MAMTLGGVNHSLTTLNNVDNALHKTIQKAATGSKYPSASFGGSAYATLKLMDSNIKAHSQSVQNVQNASAMMKTAEGATSNTISALTQIKEYLINAANGTNTETDRAALQENVNQIVSQIDDNAQVKYNGKNIVDGSAEQTDIVGLLGAQSLGLGDIRAETLGLKDSEGNVTIDVSTDEGIKSALDTVNSALETVQGINDSLTKSLDGSAIDASLDEATTQGAYLQRLDYQEALYNTMEINEQEAASTMGDADIAQAMAQFNSQSTQEKLALFAATMFNHNLANVTTLLQGA